MLSFSLRKVLVVSTVFLTHLYNICLIGLCAPEICCNGSTDLPSTIAVLAVAIVSIESNWALGYVKPLVSECIRPNVPLELLTVHLSSNMFWHLLWRPAIVPLAWLSSVIGSIFMIANNVLGGDRFTMFYDLGNFFYSMEGLSFVQIVVALFLLRMAIGKVGIVREIVAMFDNPKRGIGKLGRSRRSSKRGKFSEMLKPTLTSSTVMLAVALLVAGKQFYPSFISVDCRVLSAIFKTWVVGLNVNLFFILVWVPLTDFLEDVMGVFDGMLKELNNRIGGLDILVTVADFFASAENVEISKAICAFLMLFWVLNDLKFIPSARRFFCKIRSKR